MTQPLWFYRWTPGVSLKPGVRDGKTLTGPVRVV